MPMEWLQVLAHHTTKDKARLLNKLKYDMTIGDVHDLLEYHQYENWLNFEEQRKSQMQKQ